MTENTRDIVLEYMRRFDAKLDRFADDVRDPKSANARRRRRSGGVQPAS